MNLPLFRSEVQERNGRDWLGSVRLATPVSLQVWTTAALVVAIVIVLWLIFGSYTRREHVSGLLVPQAGVIDVASTTAGIVSRVLVVEGAHVNAGDPLIDLSGEHISETLGDTGTNISAQLRSQKAGLQTDISNTEKLGAQQSEGMRNQLAKLTGQLHQIEALSAIQAKQVDLESHLVDKISPLLDKGFIPLFQVQQERASLLSAQAQIESLRQQHLAIEQQAVSLHDQLDQTPLATSVKLGDLRRQSAQIEQSLAQNEAGRASVLRAPMEGTVSSLLARAGQTVALGQPLLAIVPTGPPLEAQLLVPSKAAGFVHPGTEVVLHYQPFPYQKFGLQRGVVREVSSSSLSPNAIAALLGGQSPPTEPEYRVFVDLAAQSVTVYGHDEPLRSGMAVDGDLLLDRRNIAEWIFEPLYAAGHQLTTAK